MRKGSATKSVKTSGAGAHYNLLGFDLKLIQNLSRDEVVKIQSAIGYGNKFGVWETPRSHLSSRHPESLRILNLRYAVEKKLPQNYMVNVTSALLKLIDEAELWLARYVLLLKVGPAQVKNGSALDSSTIIRLADRVLPQIMVEGIFARSSGAPPANGLVGNIPISLRAKLADEVFLGEFSRMRYFNDLGLWSDILPTNSGNEITNPRGAELARRPETKSEPYPPLPDSFLMSMGPRVTWILEVLAPQVLTISREITGFWHPAIGKNASQSYVATHLCHRLEIGPDDETWNAPFRNGLVAEGEQDSIDFYPRTWREYLYLLFTVQSANLWISLLATGGRIGEIMGLNVDCVHFRRNGKLYASGHKYKFSARIFGDDRDWLAPEILLRALNCQREVVEAFVTLHTARGKSHDLNKLGELPLWLSFTNFEEGTGSVVELGSPGHSLNMLAARLGVDSKSDGQWAHPHRFRKTVSKLVGTALVDGPKVLMRLLGHKDVAVAIEYILSDKSLQSEIDKVARELRVIRCKDVLQELHSELQFDHVALSSYGGGAIPEVKRSITSHERKLASLGLSWDESSAYDLAKIMTLNGQHFRYLREGVICTKVMGKLEPCTCNSLCIHRIEDATARRDVESMLPLLLRDAEKALGEGLLLVAASILDHFENEALRYDGLFEKWLADPRVMLLREALLI